MALRQRSVHEMEDFGPQATELSPLVNLAPEARYDPPKDDQFGDADYLNALDLRTIGNRLIRTCPELEHLASVEISYLWRRKGGEKHGQPTLGMCTKASGLVRYFGEVVWIIWLGADHARDNALTRRQIESVLHHELLHAGPEGIVGHDFEAFALNVKRYGAWEAGLQSAQRAFEQLRLEDAG